MLKDIGFGFVHQHEKDKKITIPMVISCIIIEILNGIYEYFQKEGKGYELSDHGRIVTNVSNEHLLIHLLISVSYQPMRILLKSDVKQKHQYKMKILKNGPYESIKMVLRSHSDNGYCIIEYAHVADGSLCSSFDYCARIRNKNRRKYTTGDYVTYTIDFCTGKFYGVVNDGKTFNIETNVKMGAGYKYYFGVALGHIGDSVRFVSYECSE